MRRVVGYLFDLSRSQTAVSTYTLFAGNLVDAILAFVFTVLIFRLLATSEFGIFSAINNFIVVTYSLLDLGVSSSLINFISYHRYHHQPDKARQYLYTGVLLRFGVALLVSLVVVIGSKPLGSNLFLVSSPTPVVLAGGAILLLSLLDVLYYSLQAYQRFSASALTAVSFSAMRLALFGLLVLSGNILSLVSALAITALAPLLGVVLAGRTLQIPLKFALPDRKILKSVFHFGGWMGLVRVFSTLTGRLDVQMMLLLAGPAVTGTYSVAARLAAFYSVVITSLTAVLAPRFASGQPLSQLKPLVAKASLFLVGLLAAMTVGIIIARPFILILFGVKAVDSILPFQYLTAAFIPFMASTLATTIIIYNLKRPQVLAILTATQLAIVAVGSAIFIPRLGSIGPAAALAIANSLVLLVSSIYIWRSWHRLF